MSWSTIRFGVAIFWLAIAAAELRAGMAPIGVTISLVLAALAVIRRSADMPERRYDAVAIWMVLFGAIAVVCLGSANSSIRGALALILWIAIAVLFWRRFDPRRHETVA